jgi:predicted transcriptional regulator
MVDWNFFTNHGHVVFLLEFHSNITLREVALKVGITERAVQKIVSDLTSGGFVKVKKEGRNNHYTVVGKKRLKHPIEKNCKLEDLIKLIGETR